jgi:hypothetical protein
MIAKVNSSSDKEHPMSTNVEWQRQQVNERVQGAMREGLAHRAVQANRRLQGRRSSGGVPFAVKAALALGAAWFFIAVSLAGCTPVEPALAGEPERAPVVFSMADRIAFQDRVWEASHPEPMDLRPY